MSDTTPSEPSDDPLLRQFMIGLGGAMIEAGDSVDRIQETLDRAALAYRADHFDHFVLPTGLFVQSSGDGRAHVLLSRNRPTAEPRFDQVAALYRLVRRAERAQVSPADGLAELAVIQAMEPPFNRVVRVLGHAILTAGIALLLQPTLGGAAVAFALGILVGLLKLPRLASLDVVFPIVAAFLVATVVFAITHHAGVGDNPMRVLIAPLVTFLPGGLLTMGTVELAAGQMISGSSRLVTGIVNLGLLAFGIVAAAELVGIGSHTLVDNPVDRLGWWAPWVGVAVIAIGNFLHFSSPLHALPWIFLVLFAAYAGQAIGAAVFGGQLSGFFGALAMTPLVLWIDRLPNGTPSMVTFLPGFWLLVPGALGLIGLTELVGVDRDLGAQDLANTFVAIISTALGVLIGSAVYQAATASVRKLSTIRDITSR